MHRARRQRRVVIYGLIGILLLMTAAYAAFSQRIDIKGSTKVTSNWDVKITNVTNGTPSGGAENSKDTNGNTISPTWDKLSASVSADLYEAGDAMEYIVTITNNGSIDATLDDVALTPSNNSAVIITYSGYAKGQKLYKKGSSNSSVDIKVKVEYNPEYTGGEATGESSISFNFVQSETKEVTNDTVISNDSYKLTYNCTENGGTGSQEAMFDVGANVDLSVSCEKSGYEFLGWNTDKDSAEILSSYTMPNSNSTLYAIYKVSAIPIIDSFSTTKTPTSITAVVSAHDDKSGIKKYEFSKDNGSTWVDNGTSGIYTFTGLTTGATFQVKVRVTNNEDISTISDSIEVVTGLQVPTFLEFVSENTTVEITYPEGCGDTLTCTYKKDNEETVTLTSQMISNNKYSVEFDDSGTLIATVSDGVNTASGSYTVVFSRVSESDVVEYDEPGDYEFTAPASGEYLLQVWGAEGGSYGGASTGVGGKGGYSYGTINLDVGDKLYVYTGGQGTYGKTTTNTVKDSGGFNGGGDAAYLGGTGGGASDIRVNSDSLYSRVIVAGGGGGAYSQSNYGASGGYGGGVIAGDGVYYSSYSDFIGHGGTQSAGGAGGTGSSSAYNGADGTFGAGGATGNKRSSSSYASAGAGGGGWYGGGAAGNYSGSSRTRAAGGGGGSGYVYTSATASNYPEGGTLDSSYYLSNAETIGGNQSFVSPTGENETGHSGDGYVKISYDINSSSNPDEEHRPVTTFVSSSADSVTVSTSSTTSENIVKYEFSSDGISWRTANSNTYTLSGLSADTTYSVKSRITLASGKILVSRAISCSTSDITVTNSAKTIDSLTVSASADTNSNIVKYEYSSDNGSTWEEASSSAYTFSGLAESTAYDVKARLTLADGNVIVSNAFNFTTETFSISTYVYHDPGGCFGIDCMNMKVDDSTNVYSNIVKYEFSIDNGEHYEVSSRENVVRGLPSNTTYNVRGRITLEDGNVLVSEPSVFTTNAPELRFSTTSNSIMVSMPMYFDTPERYEFSIDGGQTFTQQNVVKTGVDYYNPVNGDLAWVDVNSYTYENLRTGTYQIAARVIYDNGAIGATGVYSVSTDPISSPTFDTEYLSPTSTNVTITYPAGCSDYLTCNYIKDEGSPVSVTSSSVVVNFSEAGELIANVTDGTNSASRTYTVQMASVIDDYGTDLLVVPAGEGLRKVDDEYYYQGANPDNYITLGSDLYRIIGFDSDKNMKVIREEPLTGLVWDAGYSSEITDVTSASNNVGTRYSSTNGDYCYATASSYYGCKVWGSKYSMRDSSGNLILSGDIAQMPWEAGSATLKNLPENDSYLNVYLNGGEYPGTNKTSFTGWYESGVDSSVRGRIISHSWNVGPVKNLSSQNSTTDLTQASAYTWNGKIGLANVIDYAKTNGNDTACGTVYSNINTSSCRSTNWLFKGAKYWTMTPGTGNSTRYIYTTHASNYLVAGSSNANNTTMGVRPVFYLGKGFLINGDGTSEETYNPHIPEAIISHTATYNSITITATPDMNVEATKYEFSIDNGETWIDNGINNIYTFSGLTYNTSYDVKVRLTTSYGEGISHKEITTNDITPLFNQTFYSADNIDVTITYPEGCGSTFTCTYIKDEESPVTVNSTTALVNFTSEGELAAVITDGNITVSSTFSVRYPQSYYMLEKLDASAVTSGDGLYLDSSTNEYYYRGLNPNNYIEFSGDTWRIMSISPEGNLKIVKDERIGSNRQFDTSGNSGRRKSGYCSLGNGKTMGCDAWATMDNFTNGEYGGAVTADSALNTYLNNTYKNTLSDLSYVETDKSWNVGVSGSANDSLNISQLQSLESMYTWTGAIALPTKSEYLRANSDNSCTTASYLSNLEYDSELCKSNYLNKDSYSWWLLSPGTEGVESVLYAMLNKVGNKSASVSSEVSVRPALYLKSDILLNGSGTSSNPYTISDSTVNISTATTHNSVTVTAVPNSNGQVTKYEFSIDDGETWNDNGTSNVYTFNGLTPETTYTVKVRVTRLRDTLISSKEFETGSIDLPTHDVQYNAKDDIDVTITYPEGCGSTFTCTYIKDEESPVTVNSTTALVNFTSEGELAAVITDGNITVSSTFTVIIPGSFDTVEKLGASIATSGDGLYYNSDTAEYYYRGADPANYVNIGSDLYRIMEIDFDGNLKVIKDTPFNLVWDLGYPTNISGITSSSSTAGTRYSSTSTDYCYRDAASSYSGCNSWGSSTSTLNSAGTSVVTQMPLEAWKAGSTELKDLPTYDSYINVYLNGGVYPTSSGTTELTSWYSSNIPSSLQSKIVTHLWNVGQVDGTSSLTLAQNIQEEAAYKWSGKIGLMTATEYVRASTKSACSDVYNYRSNSTCYNNSSTHNWLYKESNQWTMAPISISPADLVWGAYSGGFLSFSVAIHSSGVRPVFYLSSDISISGTGTDSSNAFTVS